jgi:hypothetical protein
MDKLADALVYAVAYINCRDNADLEDDDVTALESLAYVIKQATDAELDALSAAAKRALAEELASPYRRDNWVRDYSTWMEDLFGGEGWVGNERA